MLRHIPTFICLEMVKFVSFNVKQSNYTSKFKIMTSLSNGLVGAKDEHRSHKEYS